MVSVVIPTYKSPEALDLCLQSATQGQLNRRNQIIVVVDGFYELNKEVLDKYRSLIEVLILEENQGLCRATNLGVYNTSGKRILIVNDDNIFPVNWDLILENLPKTKYGRNIVWAPNQIEPYTSMFHQFHIKDLGRDPKTFDLAEFQRYEIKQRNVDLVEENGSTLPIFMDKMDYLRLGGWDENYEKGMVADWDFFLKCNLSGLNMFRTYSLHFYHFVSLSVNDNESATINHVSRREAEILAHRYAEYKWSSKIKHDPDTNLKYL